MMCAYRVSHTHMPPRRRSNKHGAPRASVRVCEGAHYGNALGCARRGRVDAPRAHGRPAARVPAARVVAKVRVARARQRTQLEGYITACRTIFPLRRRESDGAAALRTHALLEQVATESVHAVTIDTRAIAAHVALDAMTTRLHRAASQELPCVRYVLVVSRAGRSKEHCSAAAAAAACPL